MSIQQINVNIFLMCISLLTCFNVQLMHSSDAQSELINLLQSNKLPELKPLLNSNQDYLTNINPLHEAAEYGSCEAIGITVNFLKEHGYAHKIVETNDNKETILHIAARCRPQKIIECIGNVFIKNKCAGLIAAPDNDGKTAFHKVSFDGTVPEINAVKQLFFKAKCVPALAAYDNIKNTAFNYAAYNNSPDALNTIDAIFSDIQCSDVIGTFNAKGATAFMNCAMHNQSPHAIRTTANIFINRGFSELISASKLIDEKDFGLTAFHLICKNNEHTYTPEIVDAVADAFIDSKCAHKLMELDKISESKRSPLSYALIFSSPDCINTVIKIHAKLGQYDALRPASYRPPNKIISFQFSPKTELQAYCLMLCDCIPTTVLNEYAPQETPGRQLLLKKIAKKYAQLSIKNNVPMTPELITNIQALGFSDKKHSENQDCYNSNGWFQEVITRIHLLNLTDKIKKAFPDLRKEIQNSEAEARKKTYHHPIDEPTNYAVPALSDLCLKKLSENIPTEKIISYIPIDQLIKNIASNNC